MSEFLLQNWYYVLGALVFLLSLTYPPARVVWRVIWGVVISEQFLYPAFIWIGDKLTQSTKNTTLDDTLWAPIREGLENELHIKVKNRTNG